MVYRAAVLTLLGTLLLLHFSSELRAIHRDHHIYGELQAIRAGTPQAASAPAAALDLPEGVVVVDAARAAIDRMLAATDGLGPARIVPSLRHGRMVGFKIYGVRPESVLGTLGLRSGDTLIAVNEVPVTETTELLHLFADDQLPAYLDLTIHRQGRPLRIVVLLHG